MSVNRKRADRSRDSLLYVGVRSNGRVLSPLRMLPAAFRALDSELGSGVCLIPASIDSMGSGLVSFK
jgi:hypothetical protein